MEKCTSTSLDTKPPYPIFRTKILMLEGLQAQRKITVICVKKALAAIHYNSLLAVTRL